MSPESDSQATTDTDETVDWRDDHDPDSPSLGPDVPEVDVPKVSVPEIETTDSVTTDADSDLAQTFWRLVVVTDVGLLAVALGPMFVYFEGNWKLGLTLFGFGAAVLTYGVVRYRQYRHRTSDDPSESAAENPKG